METILPIVNAMSVDVEEYFHATNLQTVAPPKQWHALPSRAEYAVQKVLDLLGAADETKATFFVLGWVARRHPQLVKRIADRGHEIASHGYGHQLAFEQSRRAFQRDIRKSKMLLEDISGGPVLGYRAPSFSIGPLNLWAYDELAEAGYRYDSSLYPVHHKRYGNAARNRFVDWVKTESGPLPVLPLAVSAIRLCCREFRLPVAGGAYWRLFPPQLIRWGLKRINDTDHERFICYFHPWELDADQPFFAALPRLTRIRHYGGIGSLPDRITAIIARFNFAPIVAAYSEIFSTESVSINGNSSSI